MVTGGGTKRGESHTEIARVACAATEGRWGSARGGKREEFGSEMGGGVRKGGVLRGPRDVPKRTSLSVQFQMGKRRVFEEGAEFHTILTRRESSE
ncbi:hypothetical protein CDAR_42411 [Caerostris darwini]|uniref:Uncharacterized protein n=1 Tax=Caerostris darwini TaxID=1538125 RepID=A0AAV4RLS8_9ARAC|nr:hypothetical protein CDAR_42411 [Caerostris darwini]